MKEPVEISVRDTVMCIKGNENSKGWYIKRECEKPGVREGIFYLVVEKINDRIRLAGIPDFIPVLERENPFLKGG